MGDMAGLYNPLPGAQVPPEIGVDGMARGHRQQAEEEYQSKSPRSPLSEISRLRHFPRAGSCPWVILLARM
jgi:hypothetical protein